MSIVHQHARLFQESQMKRNHEIERIKALFAGSMFVPQTLENQVIRSLLPQELETLRGPCHCTCQDWSKIRLLLPRNQVHKDQSGRLQQVVSRNTFSDLVVIGLADETNDVSLLNITQTDVYYKLPPGIHGNTLISNCILESHSRVYHNAVLSDTFVGVGAILSNCGSVTCGKNIKYGQLNVTVGAESGGGRRLTVSAENTMIDVCRDLGMSRQESKPQGQMDSPFCNINIIGAHSLVRDTPTLKSVYLSPHASIVAASSVSNTTMLEYAKIENSCTVSNTLLQWNSSIISNSNVSNSLLMEEAHSGPNNLVASSVLGPDVHVSGGEVHASIIGPNTNAHHQSLVIGVLWPLGRGNVGYGANVGSNHTGRLPDQETVAGEGIFWGLSTVIKFPVDLSFAPYSIVAAGTTVVPQRITMPFSLIVQQNEICNIIPGWVLSFSPYTLSRSENKFAKRRKAKRHDFYTGWTIVRPDIVDICIEARAALEQVQSAAVYKTNKHVRGIGACEMSEKGRLSGIKAYTQCIQLYALRGLFDKITKSGLSLEQFASNMLVNSAPSRAVASAQTVCWSPLPWEQDDVSLWSHQLTVLQVEFPIGDSSVTAWLITLLQRLVRLQQDYGNRVYDSKARDDTRGAKTIPGYTDSHVSADNDPVVKSVFDETRDIVDGVERILLDTAVDQTRSRL
jgi:hypothetical protein